MAMPEQDVENESYVDYEAFLSEDFSPTAFANSLVLNTNNPSDHPLDLNTPLSRVLFDVQEVDTHIDNLTQKSALPLLEYTRDHVDSASRILQQLETQVATLSEGYERLERDVLARHEAADQTRQAAERLWQTVRLCRHVSRALTLGRQLEGQMTEIQAHGKREDHKAMVRATNTILAIKQIGVQAKRGGDGDGLDRIAVMRTLRTDLVEESEKVIIQRAEQIISSFSMSSLTAANADTNQANARSATYAQMEDTRSRATSALISLYLLSPPNGTQDSFAPTRLITALQEYLRRGITSSLASLTSALASLPKLDRTLLEVSARCQNVAALEILLDSIKAPFHPLLESPESDWNPDAGSGLGLATSDKSLLGPLLTSLDTPSLPSYFWRSMASQLSARVQRILKDGGVASRSLRSSKERVRDAIRECVDRGSKLPASSLSRGKATTVRNWEREAAVMVSSVVSVIGR